MCSPRSTSGRGSSKRTQSRESEHSRGICHAHFSRRLVSRGVATWRRRRVVIKSRRSSRMNKPLRIAGTEHWTTKNGGVKLFLWNKNAGDPSGPAGRILFVHGSSMASQPTFDLQVPGRPDSSVMDFFAARGYDTWCVDMEGYGRSTKTRD